MPIRESASPFDYNNKWNIRRTDQMHAKVKWAMDKRGFRTITDYFMYLINQDVKELKQEYGVDPAYDRIYEKYKQAAQDDYAEKMMQGVIDEIIEGKVRTVTDKEARKELREKLREELRGLLDVNNE